MTTLSETTSEIDARVSELVPWIASQQEAYIAMYGKYAQLGWSHSYDPEDGEVLQPDLLHELLPGKSQTWVDFGYPVQEPRCSACIDEYVAPSGAGWVLNLSLIFSGVQYRKRVGHGPESHDGKWIEVVPLIR